MSDIKKAPATRVAEAVRKTSGQQKPLALSQALDDAFGKRFRVACRDKTITIAGNWNDQAEAEMDARMGLIEAVLLDDDLAEEVPLAHLRGFVVMPLNELESLSQAQFIECADTVNDEFLAAAMALTEECPYELDEPIFQITSVTAKTDAAEKRLITQVCDAVCRKWKYIDTIGFILHPGHSRLAEIAKHAGLSPEDAKPHVEDLRADLLSGVQWPVDHYLLRSPILSHQDASLAVGRMMAGESLTTILAGTSASTPGELFASAGRIQVPEELMTAYLSQVEGRSVSQEALVQEAFVLADSHLAAETGREPRTIHPGDRVDVSTTVLGTALYIRILAFYETLEKGDALTDMLMKLRNLAPLQKVMDIVGRSSVNAQPGEDPFFGPDFEEGIQDLYLAVRS